MLPSWGLVRRSAVSCLCLRRLFGNISRHCRVSAECCATITWRAVSSSPPILQLYLENEKQLTPGFMEEVLGQTAGHTLVGNRRNEIISEELKVHSSEGTRLMRTKIQLVFANEDATPNTPRQEDDNLRFVCKDCWPVSTLPPTRGKIMQYLTDWMSSWK